MASPDGREGGLRGPGDRAGGWHCEPRTRATRARTHTYTYTRDDERGRGVLPIRRLRRTPARARAHTHTHTHTHIDSPAVLLQARSPVLGLATTRRRNGRSAGRPAAVTEAAARSAGGQARTLTAGTPPSQGNPCRKQLLPLMLK